LNRSIIIRTIQEGYFTGAGVGGLVIPYSSPKTSEMFEEITSWILTHYQHFINVMSS